MISDQRIIYKDNSVISDLSVNLTNYNADTNALSITAAEDAIYVGSVFPWNNKYFDITVANASAASVIIKTWDGNSFKDTYDLIDETKPSSATLAQSGLIRFTPDKDISWVRQYESFTISDLSSTYILNMYWAKITFSADCSFTINYIGQKFSTDTELFGYYPDLNKTALMTQFAAGKTNWNQQHFIAAEHIIRDLIQRRIVYTADQVLDPDSFTIAAIHKCAEIIYSAFGKGYEDDKNAARKAYQDAMDMNVFKVDRNLDGRLSVGEMVSGTRYMGR